MKRNKLKRKLAILLVFVLVFAGLGTSAFAARPVKAVTIQVVESQPLVVAAGETSVSTDLIVRYDDGVSQEAVATLGEAELAVVSTKRNSTTYRMTYTKPVGYTEAGSSVVTVTFFNTAKVATEETIDIQIEADTPPPMEYTVTTVVMTDGAADPAGGTAAGAGTYEENTSVDLVASANSGYEFVGWYADAGLTNQLSTEPTYVITVTSDATYYAAFNKVIVPPTEYTITTVVKTDGTDSTIGGTAAGAGIYVENELVDLVASANSGYEFIGWYADAELITQLSTESTYVITVTSDATYYAAFNKVIVPPTEYTITTVVKTDGTDSTIGGTAAGAGTYVENELVDLVASANSGYEFVGWYADAGLTNQLSTEPTYVITVTSDATYYAAFNKVIVPPTEYTITTVVKTDGTDSTIGGTAAGAGTYVENELVDLVASANSGYEFIGWYADAELTTQLSTEPTYVITVTSDATYYAAFNEVIVPPPPEDLLYVALGDSIITGTVAPSLPDETPFIYGFKAHLEDKTKRPVTMKNFGVDGDQTGHLLARLGGPEYDGVTADQTMIDNVKAAEVISVSIAGNNLMSAAKYTTYVFFFIKVDYYDFDRIDTDKAEAGRAAVENDFPQIIHMIREYNPTAKIIATDTYNPFNKTSDADNYNLVEHYLHREGIGVNDVIRDVCNATNGVEYAEVYSAFEAYGGGDGKEGITYLYITDTYMGFELRNPHPNNIGQGLIETAAENAYDRIH